MCNFENVITWEQEELDIQKRSCLNISLIEKELGWRPEISLKRGLEATLKYHDENLTAQYLRKDSISHK